MARVLLAAVAAMVISVVVVVAALGVGSWRWAVVDDAKAPHQATLESVRQHRLPEWFRDATLGVMLHWGPYSVPGFAPTGRSFADTVVQDYDHALTRSPYAEDYANQLKDPDSPTAAFHRANFGAAPYSAFATQFENGAATWNPDAWAATFQAAGASYIVVTAKYADGYSLWPTAIRNPHAPEFHSRRDLVGELARAVRARGMKFGIYYSGGVDWTFHPAVVQTLGDYVFTPHGNDYRDYAEAQVRELIERYRPDILWNDIGWPTGQKRLNALFADYYNAVPEGVVNDRWQTSSFVTQLMGARPLRWTFDQVMKRTLNSAAQVERLTVPKKVPHSDFRTPEYVGFDTVQDTFWQQDRGIGGSFGYNRQEIEADYATPDTLVAAMVQAAANNGALLLNVGPSGGEGRIMPGQLSRLTAIGAWMAVNREALDGARPWRPPGATTDDGTRVYFTHKGSDLYLVILGKPTGAVTLNGIHLRGTGRVLGSAAPVSLRHQGGNTILDAQFPGTFAPVVKVYPHES